MAVKIRLELYVRLEKKIWRYTLILFFHVLHERRRFVLCQIYIEQLTGQRLIEDEDVLCSKLAILNSRIVETKTLRLKEYCNLLQINQIDPEGEFTVPRGVMFLLRPSEIGGVPIVIIEPEVVYY